MTKVEREQRARENRDLTRGSIFKKLLLFALPIMAGNLVQQLYNVVDSWVVGNYAVNGTACLAAVNASFSIMMFFNSLYMGISMGASIILSQYKGAKDNENLRKGMTTTFAVSMLCGIFITVVGFATARWILELLGTPADILDSATLYLRIVFLGTCGNVVYNGLNGMLRGLGDAKFPMYALILSAVLNVILDLIFVVWFQWDVAGVALATMIAHFLSGMMLLWRQSTGIYGEKIDLRHLKMDKHILKLILRLGLPAAIQNATHSAGNMVTQSFANRFGVNYIAAHAIVLKVDGFVVLPMMGVQAATTTFVGQNIGAGDRKRTNQGILAAVAIAASITLTISILATLFGEHLMAAFNVNETALQMGVRGLHIIVYFQIFFAMQNVISGALRGSGASAAAAICSVAVTLLKIPMGYILAIVPLERACRAAVEAGQYASIALAEAAGVGIENYVGLFMNWGINMAIGFLVLMPYFIWGKWRSKGITAQAKSIKE